MRSFKKLSKMKIALTVATLAIIIFGIYNWMWFYYVKTTFNPFLETLNKLEKSENRVDLLPGGWKIYTYSDYHGSGYTYTVSIPSYLEFGGNISILTPTDVDFIDGEMIYLSDCIVNITYFPRVRDYYLSITDLTTTSERSLGSAVDKNGHPLGRHPKDTEESYQEWLALYEKFNESIKEMFDTVKEVFGEDAFT